MLIILSNVVCDATAQSSFVHYANVYNIRQNWTYLDHPSLNGHPDAILQETPQYTQDQLNTGVWYDASQQRWAIFNQNRLAMRSGSGFHVVIENGFVHRANTGNIQGNYTVIDHPTCNGNANALLWVTPNYNPNGQGGTYLDHPVGVFYTAGKWAIFNQDLAPMPNGAAFNVKVVPASMAQARVFRMGEGGFSGALPTSFTRPNSVLLVTQNWNPGGTSGVYNNGVVQVGLEPDLNEWIVYTNRRRPAAGAAFNVVAYAPSGAPDRCAGNPNWDFEDGLSCWTSSGNAFRNQPTTGNTVRSDRVKTDMALNRGGIGGDYWKDMPYPIGISHNRWIGTYENGNGDAPQGTLTSQPFVADKRYLHFLLGGGKDINGVYVELQVRQSDYEAAWGTGRSGFFGNTDDGYTRLMRISPLISSEELYRYWFDLGGLLNHQFRNKTYRLVLVDNSSSGWGHLNADDFQLSDQVSDFIYVIRGGFGLYIDKNRPVWGFADTHAHPTHQLGFGGQTIGGDTDGDPATALSHEKCNAIHGGCRATDAVCLAVQKPFVSLSNTHFTDGWPTFLGWPRFQSMYHQQQHVDWIKRAYDGGLRLLCALGVNNMYWATRVLGAGHTPTAPIDDETTVLQQLELMKQIAARHAAWMEVAYTPADARRIIASNKLAIVLGVEMDNFGNYKDATYRWVDGGNYAIPPSARLEALPTDNGLAQRRIAQKLDQYYGVGIRQVTPLHYVSGVFGGTSILQFKTTLVQHAFLGRMAMKGGQGKGVYYHIQDDIGLGDALTAVLGNLDELRQFGSRAPCSQCDYSTINAEGLTDKGHVLMTELMRKGMLIDLEHQSYASIDGLFNLANRYQYPIMSSHTDPAALSFRPSTPRRFGQENDEGKWTHFGTSNIRNLPHESQLLDENYQRIRTSGGTVGVIMLPYRKTTYAGTAGRVNNDCDGSSKTWAQMYLHSLDKMNSKGVALSTDRGFVQFIAPRFGTYAAWNLTDEKTDYAKFQLRTRQRYAQTNGVRYDRPLQTWHPARLDKDVKDIDSWEVDAWKALVTWTGGINPFAADYPRRGRVPTSSDPRHGGRIESFVRGLFAEHESQLRRCCGATPQEEAAMFCLRKGIAPDRLTSFSREQVNNHIMPLYRQLLPVWTLWQQMQGNNEPLQRAITGQRDWDINLDGIAHYGMLPDFLQDLKNVGLTPAQLNPIFRSAEDYIQMWEKADRSKANVR